MPELPPPKLRSRRLEVAPHAGDSEPSPTQFEGVRYAELHCKTNFSFLCGASHPDELVKRAVQLGYAALAITDRNSLAGVVRAHVAAKAAGIKLVIGAEITPADAPPVLLYAPDVAAYRRLARLITRGRRSAPKGECQLTLDDVAEHADGVLACTVPPAVARAVVTLIPGVPRPESAKGVHIAGVTFTPFADSGRATQSEADESREEPATSVPPPFASPHPASFLRSAWERQFRRSAAPLSFAAPCEASETQSVWDVRSHAERGNENALVRYRDIFGDRCYLAVSLHLGPDDEERLERLVELARRTRLPLVATNDVHYHEPGRRYLQDVLTAIGHGCTVPELGARRFANGERYLKSPVQMAELFRRCPAAIARTVELADRCNFSLDELRYEYPEELCPPGLTPTQHLAQLTWAGANGRYPTGVPDKVRRLLEHELRLIEELRYQPYFLTVWDLIQFARLRNILCQGRGSAANSAVCFCLGITSVDPDRTDVLFERFVSRERNEPPDIDVDFEHERREEVFQYIYQKYGRERAGIVAEVISYRPRSAVRDVGKALGLSLDRVNVLAKTLDHGDGPSDLSSRVREAGLDPQAPAVRQLLRLATELLGFPRHLSQHVGGFVITRGPLCELVPIENAAMPERTVIEWDKDAVDALGILKVDCLALGMLTAIHKCFDLVSQHHGVELTLASIPAEDPAVYDMICRADTIGVFQIESRAQMSMLPRLRPRSFYDLVIEVAIVRPGPIQGGMVHPYLRRRGGREPVAYPSEAVQQVLEKTLGVPIFQEQAMRLAMVAAGFTPGEADQLRRAMGAWRRPGVIEQFRTKLRDGMIARDLPAAFADQLYEQLRGFGEYGFPESHAASFALLAYVSAWLKLYYPAAFAAAVLNSQPMGFYAPAQLVRDAQSHGVTVCPVDVNHSGWDCTLGLACDRRDCAPLAVRLGFRLVKGLPRSAADAIVAARGDHAEKGVAYLLPESRRAGKGCFAQRVSDPFFRTPFRSVSDIARRTGLGRPVLARLAAADAFGSLGLSRRAALWDVLCIEKELPLFAGVDDNDQPPPLAPMPLDTQVVADYASIGLSLKAHPISFLRSELDALHVLPASALAHTSDKAMVQVAGLVLVRQQPSTAKGTIFVTLEDETGIANLIIWPDVWERYRRPAREAVALLARGKLQRADGVIHVCVVKLEDLSDRLAEIRSASRDFR